MISKLTIIIVYTANVSLELSTYLLQFYSPFFMRTYFHLVLLLERQFCWILIDLCSSFDFFHHHCWLPLLLWYFCLGCILITFLKLCTLNSSDFFLRQHPLERLYKKETRKISYASTQPGFRSVFQNIFSSTLYLLHQKLMTYCTVTNII